MTGNTIMFLRTLHARKLVLDTLHRVIYYGGIHCTTLRIVAVPRHSPLPEESIAHSLQKKTI